MAAQGKQNNVIDKETAAQIQQSAQMKNFDPDMPVKKSTVALVGSQQVGQTSSFKQMKQKAKSMRLTEKIEQEMNKTEDVEMIASVEVETVTANNPVYYDKIMKELARKVITVGAGDLNEFPKVELINAQISFKNMLPKSARNIFEVN